MRTSFAIAALVGAASAATETESAFFNFITKFGKSYSTMEEYTFRFAEFADKHAFIQTHNASQNDYKLGHNKMSDWTDAEYKAILKYNPSPVIVNDDNMTATQLKAVEPINWVDLGAVEPIKDQGQCGSCWAFSSVSATESAHFIASGNLVSMSEQQLVDCVNLCFGCNGGNATFSFRYYESHYAMSEASYPYTAKNGNCAYSSSNNTGVHTTSWVNVPQSDYVEMKQALMSAPLSVAIQADQRIFQSYSSGVFTNTECGTQLDHATNVVGWGTDSAAGDYWLMRNSWGTSWGMDGYMKLQIVDGNGLCGIQMQPVYPITN